MLLRISFCGDNDRQFSAANRNNKMDKIQFIYLTVLLSIGDRSFQAILIVNSQFLIFDFGFFFSLFIVVGFAYIDCKFVESIQNALAKNVAYSDDLRIIGGHKAKLGDFKGVVSGLLLFTFFHLFSAIVCKLNENRFQYNIMGITCVAAQSSARKWF